MGMRRRLGGTIAWCEAIDWPRKPESGAPEGIRTPNRRIRSAVLYPLSYERVYETVFMLPCRPVNVKRAALSQ